jgi:D-alanyl-D-alanine carboxypeptidase
MTEGTPLTPEEFRQLNRDLMEKILDRAAGDTAWKRRLLDDPEAAMAEAGFPEIQQLRQVHTRALASDEAEVVGHSDPASVWAPPGTGYICVDPLTIVVKPELTTWCAPR